MNDTSWKRKALALGTLAGAVLGLATAYMMVKEAEKEGGSLQISTTDWLKTGLSVVATMRSIAALSAPKI